jgi:hypothetical protein
VPLRSLLLALALLSVTASAASAARVSIYPRHPDPRLTLVVKVTGLAKVPQPLAGIACNGDEPRGDTELNADAGAPLIFTFAAPGRCIGDPLTAAVFSQSGSEVARHSATFVEADDVRIVPFLMPRGYQYPLLRPPHGRYYPGARIGLEAAGLPARHHFSARVQLIGRPHQRGCKVREDAKQGVSDSKGTLTGGQIAGYPAPESRPFCRGRSYSVALRDVSDDALYGGLTLKIRRSSGAAR